MKNLVFFLCLSSFILSTEASGLKKFITFEFIANNYSTKSYTVDNFKDVLSNPKFNRQKQTVIYSYGFTQTVYQSSVREIVDAYLANGDFNFVLVNYNSILAYNILSANEFAEHIASSLINFFENDYGNFHFIGFSLGAQISGAIGRSIIKQSNYRFKLPRITGLDPGQIPPGFGSIIKDLGSGDADFVDTIHGETKFFGSATSLGDMSFWINGGVYQPSCHSIIFTLTSVCSHLTTPKFWAESVRSKDPQRFVATQCENYQDFRSKKCDRSSTASMGVYAVKNSSGRFYLDAKLNHITM